MVHDLDAPPPMMAMFLAELGRLCGIEIVEATELIFREGSFMLRVGQRTQDGLVSTARRPQVFTAAEMDLILAWLRTQPGPWVSPPTEWIVTHTSDELSQPD